jgi:hypothetical protein
LRGEEAVPVENDVFAVLESLRESLFAFFC